MKPRHRLLHRQEILVPPQALRPLRDRLAGDLTLHRGVVVLDLVWPKALFADVERLDADPVAALFTLETQDVVHGRVFPSRHAGVETKNGLFIRRGRRMRYGILFLSSRPLSRTRPGDRWELAPLRP